MHTNQRFGTIWNISDSPTSQKPWARCILWNSGLEVLAERGQETQAWIKGLIERFGSVEASLNKSSDKEVESLKARPIQSRCGESTDFGPPYVGRRYGGVQGLLIHFWSRFFIRGKCTCTLYFEKDHIFQVEHVVNMPHFRDYRDSWSVRANRKNTRIHNVQKQELILDLNPWLDFHLSTRSLLWLRKC